MRTKDNIIVWLKAEVRLFILANAQAWENLETGGVLIGYWSGTHDVVICDVIGPGPEAVHRAASFLPDHNYQVVELRKRYFDSGRTESYLGDWHTHPGANAYLSGIDRSTLASINAHKLARLKIALMLVYGTDPEEIKIWSCRRGGLLRRTVISECTATLY